MAKQTILVTGANGQLGSELRDLAPAYPQYTFVFLDREAFPINDEAIAEKLFEQHRPAYLVNCAAYTAVDKAETEKEQAKAINGAAPGMLARLCKKHETRFLHVSTDYVFNGQATAPLKETDAVDPVNYYGDTKLLGEQLALEHNPESLIIRTSWVYSYYGKNFVKTMMRLMGEKESLGVVNDQSGAPTYAADLAEAIMTIIASGKWVPGIYHYSNQGAITWFDFAVEIRDLIGASCVVNPIKTEQFPTPAKRPAYSVFDTSKIAEVYGLLLKDWRYSLKVCIEKLKAVS